MRSATYHWHTSGRNQGQIVEERDPQRYGAAEGTSRRDLERLTLWVDRSDGEWSIYRDGKRIMHGTSREPIPAPDEVARAAQ